MENGPKIANVAAMVGDPARATMLASLMDGRALTASELAFLSGITPQTASGHLAKLVDAHLLTVEKQGRHRYFRLGSANVARLLEQLMVVAEASPARVKPHWRGGSTLRRARSCYDHLAGEIAVEILDVLQRRNHVVLTEDGGEVTSEGHAFFVQAGIAATPTKRRVFCRPCLDWSERRPHLAGALGAALLDHALQQDWMRRIADSRALTVTTEGHRCLAQLFGIDLSDARFEPRAA